MDRNVEDVRFFENIFFCWRFFDIATPEMILIAICFFMHQNDYAHAFFFAEKFLKLFGVENSEIKYFLPASEIFVQMGFKNKEIVKSSDLFRYFEGLNNKESLKEIFENKTTAVVGNGPSALGCRLGEQIDSHDLVVRFNNFTLTDNLAEDYGKKVDMWYLAVWEEKERFVLPDYMKSLKYLFLDTDYRHSKFSDGLLDVLWTVLNKHKIQVIVNDFELKNIVKSAYKISYPSSGFQVLGLLKTLNYPKTINAYGFSFQDKKKNRRYICNHYHNSVVSTKNWHNFERENDILGKIFPLKNDKASANIDDKYINMYKELHEDMEGFGRSSNAYFDEVCLFIDYLKPESVLDYGCGKGAIIKLLQEKYPHIKFYGYDPAVPKYQELTIKKADFVINTDVLEHIPEMSLDGIINDISKISQKAFFALHHAPAVAILPNGENAHCTVKSLKWYEKLIGRHYKTITSLKSRKIYLSTIVTFDLPENIKDEYDKIMIS